jgi:hypothetical protein
MLGGFFSGSREAWMGATLPSITVVRRTVNLGSVNKLRIHSTGPASYFQLLNLPG